VFALGEDFANLGICDLNGFCLHVFPELFHLILDLSGVEGGAGTLLLLLQEKADDLLVGVFIRRLA